MARRSPHVWWVIGACLLAAAVAGAVLLLRDESSPPAPARRPAETRLQAETLRLSPETAGGIVDDDSLSAGRGLTMWGNARALGSVVTADASTQIVIRARGRQCAGAPELTLDVDGARRLTASVSATTWTEYSADVRLPRGRHAIEVGFANDYQDETCDRNVFLDAAWFLPRGARRPGAGTTGTPAAPPARAPEGRVDADDRLWHPGPKVQALPRGDLPGSLTPGTFASIQRRDSSDIQVANNPGGLKLADGRIRKSLRLAVDEDDVDVAGSTSERSRAAVVSPYDLYGYGTHAFFGFGMYVDENLPSAGAIASWYGTPANGSGPMTIYGRPHPTDPSKAVVRMTRDPSRYSGTDVGDPSQLSHPWAQEVLQGHTYAFVFDVQFSSRFDSDDPYNPHGGSFKVWVSVDGGPYEVSPNVTGTDRFATQTFDEGVSSDFYFKGAQIYSSEVGSEDTVVNFLPPSIGKTFPAADVLKP